MPHLTFILNGGVKTLEQAAALMVRGVAGVMIGRQAVTDPFLFASSHALCNPRSGSNPRPPCA
jgi:tRNA-dihydrouridine synthase A